MKEVVGPKGAEEEAAAAAAAISIHWEQCWPETGALGTAEKGATPPGTEKPEEVVELGPGPPREELEPMGSKPEVPPPTPCCCCPPGGIGCCWVPPPAPLPLKRWTCTVEDPLTANLRLGNEGDLGNFLGKESKCCQ